MVQLKVTSFNVRGLRNEIKRRKIFNFLHEHKFDVIMLQETHSTRDDCRFWEAEWGGKIFFSHGSSAAKGTAILIRKNLNVLINHEHADADGRVVAVSFVFEEIEFCCASIYAPNVDDVNFLYLCSLR